MPSSRMVSKWCSSWRIRPRFRNSSTNRGLIMNNRVQEGIYNINGNVAQVFPAPGVDIYQETERLANGSPWMVVWSDELPDDYFRDAWFWDANVEHPVTIDMYKARNVQRSVINLGIPAMRSELVDELNQAIVDGDTEQELIIRQKLIKLKGILADPRIAAAETPEELKLLTLEYLMDN